MGLQIVGVHKIPADEPCYLIEVKLLSDLDALDWGAITQELDDQPPDNWQVPYDEQPVSEDGKRWVFFFHYLEFDMPLVTPDGPLTLPPPTEIPKHLQRIEYCPP